MSSDNFCRERPWLERSIAASADPPSLKLRRASMTPWPPKPWRRRLEPAASVRAGLRT